MRSEKRGGEPLYEPCRPQVVGRPLTRLPSGTGMYDRSS